jgi:hypothetical protein
MCNLMPESSNKTNVLCRILICVILFLSLIVLNLFFSLPITNVVSAQSPSATPDRLAEPVLSENPSEYELGDHLFWLHCMACHGDQGQGLTDEFRQLWPEDHQNCWGRGCHGGRMEDEGFPIPSTIPAIIFPSENLSRFSTLEDLIDYLRSTHPPQNPGYLLDEEYKAIATYVLAENDLLQPNKIDRELKIVIATLVCLGVLISLILIRGRKRKQDSTLPSRNSDS